MHLRYPALGTGHANGCKILFNIRLTFFETVTGAYHKEHRPVQSNDIVVAVLRVELGSKPSRVLGQATTQHQSVPANS